MAREATITQEQVNAAADAIRSAGTKPTARTVREAVGGGSMATVLKFLQSWQAGQVRTAEAPVTLPAGLQRSLVDFIGQEVSAAKLELQADLAAATQANGDLIAESERQASTIELQAEALDQVQGEKAEMAGRLAQVESDLVRAADDNAHERQAAELARTELAKAQLRLEALPRIEAEADRLRSELERERTAKVAAEQAAAVATARLDAEQAAHKAAQAREQALAGKLDQAEKQAAQATQELTSARIQVQAQQAGLDAAAREIAQAQTQAKEARAEAKKASEETAELRGRLTAMPAKPTKPQKSE